MRLKNRSNLPDALPHPRPGVACVLRSAGCKKSHKVIQGLPAERASEGGHVGPDVHDPDDGLITGESVPDIGEIGTAMPAVSETEWQYSESLMTQASAQWSSPEPVRQSATRSPPLSLAAGPQVRT